MQERGDVILIPPWRTIERGEVLVKLNRLESLRRLKISNQAISRTIQEMEEAKEGWRTPRNPREEVIQNHDRRTLEVLKRQRTRQEEKIKLLEEQIKQDIEISKTK